MADVVMGDPTPPSPGRRRRRRTAPLAVALVVAWLVASVSVAVAAEPGTSPRPEGEELFGVATPIGRIEYHAGRGLRLGGTGLTLGGFTTAEAVALEGGDREGGLEGINFFVFLDPAAFLHFFAEIELGELAKFERGRKGVRSNPQVEIDRLYADLTASDALGLRVGQFFTPLGLWNQTPAEPLVWTTSEPVIVEEVFDEATSGAMLFGSLFPDRGTLSYALYGTFFDPFTPDPDVPHARRTAGARLAWAAGERWSVGGSVLTSQRRHRDWNVLGGVDGRWVPDARVELTGEAVFGEGTRAEGALWGLFAQAAVETVPALWAVGRYEHFDPPGGDRPVDLFDLGIAWVPRYYLRLKADWRVGTHHGELAPTGFFASVSLLF